MDWINTISNEIDSKINNTRMPFPKLPALPLYCDTIKRPGLSAISIASKIISRLPEIGIPNGVNPDGSDNLVNKFIMVICEEFVNAIKDDGVIMTSIPTGQITVTASGASPSGPVEVIGYNTVPTVIKGVMQ